MPVQEAISQLCSPIGLFIIVLGTTLGVFVGAIPGLTGTMLIALALPLTYGQDTGFAMMLLISIYVGAISGGMISSTLLRMPGTPASTAASATAAAPAAGGSSVRSVGSSAAAVAGTCLSF